MHLSITWFPCVFKCSTHCVSTYHNNECVKTHDDIHEVSSAKKVDFYVIEEQEVNSSLFHTFTSWQHVDIFLYENEVHTFGNNIVIDPTFTNPI